MKDATLSEKNASITRLRDYIAALRDRLEAILLQILPEPSDSLIYRIDLEAPRSGRDGGAGGKSAPHLRLVG